jgi:hypothetical protein
VVGASAQSPDICGRSDNHRSLDRHVIFRGEIRIALALLCDALRVELDRLQTLLRVVILNGGSKKKKEKIRS